MPVMSETVQADAIGVEQFRRELDDNLHHLRQALRQMIVELGSPRTPTLLQRQLGTGYTICWQIFQVAGREDGSAGTQHAPSLGALKRLVVTAQAKGVSAETARSVEEAADVFHRFIREHAEDRDYFDSMVAGASQAGNARNVLVQRRRAAYRANSHVWGVQNDVWLVSGLVRRSPEDPSKLDLVVLSRQQGLRRLRADAAVSLLGMKIEPASGNSPGAIDPVIRDAVDPNAAAATGMPLLPEFSTVPFPAVTCKVNRNGRREFNWIGDSVGLKSSCDIATGTITRGIPLYVEPGPRRRMVAITSSVLSKASALLVLDLLLHRESFPNAQVRAMVHEPNEAATSLEDLHDVRQFTIEEDVEPLGRAGSINLADFPRYRSMLQHATDRVGWDLNAFDAYRLRVPYPVMGLVHRLYLNEPDAQ